MTTAAVAAALGRARRPRTMAATPSGSPIQKPPAGSAHATVDPGMASSASTSARPGLLPWGARSTAGRVIRRA